METEEGKKNDAEVIRSGGKLNKLPDMGAGAGQDQAGKQMQQFCPAGVTLIHRRSEEEAAVT